MVKHPNRTVTFFLEYGEPTDEAMLRLHGLGADNQMGQPQVHVFAEMGSHVLVPNLLGQ